MYKCINTFPGITCHNTLKCQTSNNANITSEQNVQKKVLFVKWITAVAGDDTKAHIDFTSVTLKQNTKI